MLLPREPTKIMTSNHMKPSLSGIFSEVLGSLEVESRCVGRASLSLGLLPCNGQRRPLPALVTAGDAGKEPPGFGILETPSLLAWVWSTILEYFLLVLVP